MTVTGISWHWFSGGNGDHTVDVNIAAAQVGAQIALHGFSGGGTGYAGISRYRGPFGEEHVFGGHWQNRPPVIFDRVSQITFALVTGSNTAAYAVARIDFWE